MTNNQYSKVNNIQIKIVSNYNNYQIHIKNVYKEFNNYSKKMIILNKV